MASEDQILGAYDLRINRYAVLAKALEERIDQALTRAGLRVHQVKPRVKERADLIEKLRRRDSRYSGIEQITDIVGVRVITYFDDEVDLVAGSLLPLFEVDPVNSVDKRREHYSNEFGYLSRHYVGTLKDEYLQLPEEHGLADIKVEIQIRSLLQHAWAEVNHDLGYKSTVVPPSIARRLAAVASLLELADKEFREIRDDLKEHRHQVVEALYHSLNETEIDAESLAVYVQSSDLVRDLDRKIAGASRSKFQFDEDDVSETVPRLRYFGIDTYGQLELVISQFGEIAVRMGAAYIGGLKSHPSVGLSLNWLCYALAARNDSIDDVLAFMETYQLDALSEEDKFNLAGGILGAFRLATSEEA